MDKSDRKGVSYLLWGEPGRSPAGAGSFLGIRAGSTNGLRKRLD